MLLRYLVEVDTTSIKFHKDCEAIMKSGAHMPYRDGSNIHTVKGVRTWAGRSFRC